MATARRAVLDLGNPGWVHCVSRCVRRAFLAGDGFEHRKAWIEERLRLLATTFAGEVAAYAIMSNHIHVVVRMQPDVAARWSALEVARRWMSIYPRQYLSDGTPVLQSDAVLAAQARDAAWVESRRKRLADLSWFMKALKEPIARRANREDGCTGAFWEERFTSVPLLDQAALIACMAYVDLNPVRARVADRPERSRHTAVRERIRARQRHRAAQRIVARDPRRAPRLLAMAGVAAPPQHAEEGLWVAPLARCRVGESLANKRLTAEEYLALVDRTGRLLREGKRGRIPPELAAILSRLDLRAKSDTHTTA